MRVVLDTNVLVSAFISKQGNPASVLDLVTTFDEITLVLSDEILEEFEDVMERDEVRRRFGYNRAEISEFASAIKDVADIVKPKSDFKIVKEDPKDDMVLNAAYEGKASYVVSGDSHLQKIRKFRGIKIVSPREFMRIMTRRFGELIIS